MQSLFSTSWINSVCHYHNMGTSQCEKKNSKYTLEGLLWLFQMNQWAGLRQWQGSSETLAIANTHHYAHSAHFVASKSKCRGTEDVVLFIKAL